MLFGSRRSHQNREDVEHSFKHAVCGNTEARGLGYTHSALTSRWGTAATAIRIRRFSCVVGRRVAFALLIHNKKRQSADLSEAYVCVQQTCFRACSRRDRRLFCHDVSSEHGVFFFFVVYERRNGGFTTCFVSIPDATSSRPFLAAVKIAHNLYQTSDISINTQNVNVRRALAE